MTGDRAALEAIQELFSHTWDVRAAVIHALARVPWDKASTPESPHKRSLVDAAVDLLETEAYWAHHVLDNGAGEWSRYDRANVKNADIIGIHAAGVEKATAARLASLPPEELRKPRPAPEQGEWTAADVLLRAVTSQLVECGMMAARLTALGVPPTLPAWEPTPR